MADWRTGHDRDSCRSTPRQKIELDFEVLEIVQNLVCGTFVTPFERQQLLHVVEVEVRDAPAFYLPGGAQFLKCFNSFLERRRSLAPVEKIKIDRIDAETLEAPVTCLWQFLV